MKTYGIYGMALTEKVFKLQELKKEKKSKCRKKII